MTESLRSIKHCMSEATTVYASIGISRLSRRKLNNVMGRFASTVAFPTLAINGASHPHSSFCGVWTTMLLPCANIFPSKIPDQSMSKLPTVTSAEFNILEASVSIQNQIHRSIHVNLHATAKNNATYIIIPSTYRTPYSTRVCALYSNRNRTIFQATLKCLPGASPCKSIRLVRRLSNVVTDLLEEWLYARSLGVRNYLL
mmetsp:Transcript_23352/g.55365  ORF Transcript_23352/g.55365 Transcript_23352/m.55365 type:complete len:200 (-) Transcript_23352:141-740(-)